MVLWKAVVKKYSLLVLIGAVLKKLVSSFKNQEPHFQQLTTKNWLSPPQLLLVDSVLVLSIHLADEACIALQYCFVYSHWVDKTRMMSTSIFAERTTAPSWIRKENPLLPCDTNPRPYPNEYGRLFFEDKSGNNRMVPSERTGEWAAPPGGDLL